MEKLPAQYVSDELVTRHGDIVWCMRLGDDWVYLLVLLEFQSEDDARMALRILTYTSLLYQELGRSKAPIAARRLPPVLPVVLYNGADPWRAPLEVSELIAPVGASLAPYQPAQRHFVLDERHVRADDLPTRNLMSAVIRLEQSRSLRDMERVAQALRAWLQGPGDGDLWRAIRRLDPSDRAPADTRRRRVPPMRTLEEVSMTLAERVAEWPQQWLREGREQGLEEGLEHVALPPGGGAVQGGHRRTFGGALGSHWRRRTAGRGRRLATALHNGRRIPRPCGSPNARRGPRPIIQRPILPLPFFRSEYTPQRRF